eukprot:2793711-Rhodomonas_salina.1
MFATLSVSCSAFTPNELQYTLQARSSKLDTSDRTAGPKEPAPIVPTCAPGQNALTNNRISGPNNEPLKRLGWRATFQSRRIDRSGDAVAVLGSDS